MNRFAPLLLASALPLFVFPPMRAQSQDVFGFERRNVITESHPAGWTVNTTGSSVALDSVIRHGGRFSVRITRVGTGAGAVLLRTLPGMLVRGRHVRLTGWIRTDSVTMGWAGLWLRVDGEDRMIRLDNMATRGARGTTDWQQYTIELDVDSAATNVVFGALHPGNGTAWFDDLAIEIDGAPYDPTAVTPPAPAQVEWVRRHAVSFDTEHAGNGFADLRPVLDIVGDARIVALGEGTHGSAEFFRMKHRLTEQLAIEKGFTVFAIEANMPESRIINEYVLTGRGDPRAALRGIYFWTWNTEEVLAMIEWMRAYNASGRGRIEFWGFDMQYPNVAADSVRAFLTRADPAFVTAADSAYAVVRDAVQRRQTDRAPPTAEWRSAAARVLEHMNASRSRYLAGRDSMEVAWAIQNARIVLQAGDAGGGGVSRDSSMALNVRWMMDHLPAGTKAVLWAHNAHVHRQQRMMGASLDAMYGAAMRVIGFTFYEGSYTAVGPRGLTTYPATPAPAGTIDVLFRATSQPRLLLDLRPARTDPAAAWLREPLGLRMIGAVATDGGHMDVSIPRLYDALIYFEQSTASKLLPRN